MQSLSMIMSGKDFLKSDVLIWWRKMYLDWEYVTSSGRAFQSFGYSNRENTATDGRSLDRWHPERCRT